MRKFKKGFVEEGSSRVSAGRTFKSLVEMKNHSLSISSHLNTISNLPNLFEGFGKVLIFFRVYYWMVVHQTISKQGNRFFQLNHAMPVLNELTEQVCHHLHQTLSQQPTRHEKQLHSIMQGPVNTPFILQK